MSSADSDKIAQIEEKKIDDIEEKPEKSLENSQISVKNLHDGLDEEDLDYLLVPDSVAREIVHEGIKLTKEVDCHLCGKTLSSSIILKEHIARLAQITFKQ